jgi:hypothetical protein
MTYKDYFVAEVKCNGRILRVIDDKVYLPFGSEYSLLLKNLNTKRARANITIDGTDVLDYHSLVLGANETSEILGFMKNNQVHNRFKFIEKTQEISDYRGDKIEDGLIRIEFAYEQPVVYNWTPFVTHRNIDPNYWTYTSKGDDVGRGICDSSMSSPSFSSSSQSSGPSKSSLSEVNCYFNNDQGITVPGSEVKQDFHYTTFGTAEPSQVIVLKLIGRKDAGQYVEQPREIKTRCQTCGRTASGTIKYCPNCGTYLL